MSVFGNSPKNHHQILEFLKPMPETSLIRVDNHEDLIKSSFGYSLPCARYMNVVFQKQYFDNVFWISKNFDYKVRSYENNGSFLGDYHFNELDKALNFLSNASFEKIVLDIDPDILADYDTGFSKGSMKNAELTELIKHFDCKKNIQLFFLAGPKEFLGELLKDAFYCIQ
jgi:hypothetical protein